MIVIDARQQQGVGVVILSLRFQSPLSPQHASAASTPKPKIPLLATCRADQAELGRRMAQMHLAVPKVNDTESGAIVAAFHCESTVLSLQT